MVDRSKFIFTKKEILDDNNTHLIFLTDYVFWSKYDQQLQDWCREHGCYFTGMTVDVPNEHTSLLFILRW